MRILVCALTVAITVSIAHAQQAASPTPPTSVARPQARNAPAVSPRPVGTMSELMVHVIRPTSDAVFYVTSRTPTTSEDWEALQTQTLALAESAVVLMLPAHARGRAQWLADALLMRDAGRQAFEAAKAKDVAALEALNDSLYQSCVTCHEHFRPGFGKRP